MSQTFKCKNNKVKKKDIRVTLDVKHEEKKKYFLKQKESIKEKEALLLSLKSKLKDKLDYGLNNLNNKEFNYYLEIKDKISELEIEIENLKNNKEEIDYLLNTGELVFQYYENINKIALGKSINYNIKDSKNKINVSTDKSKNNKKVIDFFISSNINKTENINDNQSKTSFTTTYKIDNLIKDNDNAEKEEVLVENNKNDNFLDDNAVKEEVLVENNKNDNSLNNKAEKNEDLIENNKNDNSLDNKAERNEDLIENNKNDNSLDNNPKNIDKTNKFNDNLLFNFKDSEIVKQTDSRIKILNKYLSIVDNVLINQDENSEDDSYICQKCNIEKYIIPNEATLICKNCGEISYILLDSEKPSYKDPPKEISYFAYKRINHFNEWLAQFQAKESTDIPETVYDQILMEIKKERIENMANLKPPKLRNLLKKLKLNKYYEHVPHIMNRLNGIPAPVMNRETEEILRSMFKEIQNPFMKYCPKDRKNFLSYSYVLHKFVQLLNMDEFLVCFPLLKSREKLHQQDIIWKQICDDLNWEFIKSL